MSPGLDATEPIANAEGRHMHSWRSRASASKLVAANAAAIANCESPARRRHVRGANILFSPAHDSHVSLQAAVDPFWSNLGCARMKDVTGTPATILGVEPMRVLLVRLEHAVSTLRCVIALLPASVAVCDSCVRSGACLTFDICLSEILMGHRDNNWRFIVRRDRIRNLVLPEIFPELAAIFGESP
jgi:hypothetical protein